MEKIIQLPNRNGDKNYLEFLRKGRDWQHLIWYKLNLEHDELGIRTGYSKLSYIDKNCVFIDPSGGPFMEVDKYKINGLLLKKIVFNNGVKLGFVEDK